MQFHKRYQEIVASTASSYYLPPEAPIIPPFGMPPTTATASTPQSSVVLSATAIVNGSTLSQGAIISLSILCGLAFVGVLLSLVYFIAVRKRKGKKRPVKGSKGTDEGPRPPPPPPPPPPQQAPLAPPQPPPVPSYLPYQAYQFPPPAVWPYQYPQPPPAQGEIRSPMMRNDRPPSETGDNRALSVIAGLKFSRQRPQSLQRAGTARRSPVRSQSSSTEHATRRPSRVRESISRRRPEEERQGRKLPGRGAGANPRSRPASAISRQSRSTQGPSGGGNRGKAEAPKPRGENLASSEDGRGRDRGRAATPGPSGGSRRREVPIF